MAVQESISSRSSTSLVIESIFLCLAYVSVAARLYVRHLTRKAIAIDDYLIIAALVFTTGTIGIGFALVFTAAAGRHLKDATPDEITMLLKLFVPACIVWALSTAFVKLSILFFYISVFTMDRVRIAVYVIIILTASLLVGTILESFLLCRPFAYTWDKTIDGGVCGDTRKSYVAIASMNLIVDFMVVALPMPIVWQLKMAAKKKIAISAILGLGLIICALSGARIKSVLDLDPSDFSYSVVPDLILGALEVTLGIVNACLPLLKPLAKRWFGSNPGGANLWTKTSGNTNAERGFRSPRTSTGTKNFRRLHDDQYPLGNLPISFPRAHVESNGDDHDHQHNATDNGHIVVKKDIYMYSSAIASAHAVV